MLKKKLIHVLEKTKQYKTRKKWENLIFAISQQPFDCLFCFHGVYLFISL